MYLLAVSYSIFGYSLEVGRLMLIGASTLAILAVFALARELYSSEVGLFAASIFAFFPVDVIIGSWITPTTLSASLTCFALFFLSRYLLHGKNFGLVAIFTFISLLADEWGLVVVGVLIVASLLFFKDRKILRPKVLLGIGISISPVLALNVASSVFLHGSSYVSNNVSASGITSFLSEDLSTLATQLTTATIIPTAIGLFSIAGLLFCVFRRTQGDKLLVTLLLFSVLAVVGGTTLSGGLYPENGRYLITLTPVLSILSARGIQCVGTYFSSVSKDSTSPPKDSVQN